MGTLQRRAPPPLFATSCRAPDVKKWDGTGRKGVPWDGLRRDADLWLPDGDCLVHLYKKGRSRRGPSFRVSYQAVSAARFAAALLAGSNTTSSGRSSPTSSSDESCNSNSPTSSISLTDKVELFLGAPSGISREEVFRWHITTRNVFAWLTGKPLIGENLAWALASLCDRLQAYGEESSYSVPRLLDYAHDIGYLDFVDCPDHALAMLSFAEKYQIQHLWTEAFAHCVGMSDGLLMSGEFESISRVSKALITRAYLEMDLHIGRATHSVGTFLEEELSSAHLGLTKSVRAHLDSFRSFLQSYCVAKFGYWPPSRDTGYSKQLYSSMHTDFRALYDYLADKEVSKASRIPTSAIGGICVLQNIDAFNKRHRYEPLPYPLPLIPLVANSDGSSQVQRVRLSVRLGLRDSKPQKAELVRSALSCATNRGDVLTMSSTLVQAYARFELEHVGTLEERVSFADARKVRWILVYAMLQMLSSLTHYPSEVRNAAAASYPLCCLTVGTPPWKPITAATTTRTSGALTPPTATSPLSSPSTPATSIQPDCETTDYFTYLPKHSDEARSPGTSSSTGSSESSPTGIRSSRSFQLLRPRSLLKIRPPRFSNPPPPHSHRHSTSITATPVITTVPGLYWSNDPAATESSSDDDNTSNSDGSPVFGGRRASGNSFPAFFKGLGVEEEVGVEKGHRHWSTSAKTPDISEWDFSLPQFPPVVGAFVEMGEEHRADERGRYTAIAL